MSKGLRIPSIDRIVDHLALFLGIWIILSMWGGFLAGITPSFILLAFIATYLLGKKLIPAETHFGDAGGASILLFLVFASIATFVLFGIQGGYDLSADATPTIAADLIQGKIPSTYAPYFSDVPFVYQLGLPVLAAFLRFTGIETHVLLWGLALLGIFLALHYLIRFFHRMGKPLLGWVAGALFVTSRYVSLNVLVGEYPWLLALGLGLGAWYWFPRGKLLSTILLAATFLVHPYIGLGALFFLVATQRPTLNDILFLGMGAAVANIPVLVFQIIPFLQTPHAFVPTGFVFSLSQFTSIPSLLGVVPFVLAVVLLVWGICTHRKGFSDEMTKRMGFAALIFIILFLAFQFFPIATFAPKLLQWGSVALVIFGVLLLPAHLTKKHIALLTLVILIAGFGILYTSSSIEHFVKGSKSTLEEAQFAHAIRDMDPSLKTTLFLTNGSGKMAQFAHKIPLDAMSANFTLALFLMGGDVAQRYKDESLAIQKMIKEKCISCVDQYSPDYILVNQSVFPSLGGRDIAFVDGNFILYRNH